MSKDTNKYHGCKGNNLVQPFTIVSADEGVKNYLLPFKETNRMNFRNETVAPGVLFLMPPVKYFHRNCLLRLKTCSHWNSNGIILLILVQLPLPMSSNLFAVATPMEEIGIMAQGGGNHITAAMSLNFSEKVLALPWQCERAIRLSVTSRLLAIKPKNYLSS